MAKKLILFFLFFQSTLLFAQQTILLSGTVKDKGGVPVQGAGIYISGYKLATITDMDGNFKFTTLNPGNYDLLIQMIGFVPLKVSATLEQLSVNKQIVLEEVTTDIKEVVIKPDGNRQHYLKLFKDFFIGTTPNANKCEILNLEDLDTNYDPKTNILKVTTDNFIEIVNEGLGYKIKYLLVNFEYDLSKKRIYYEGFPTFEEIAASNSKLKKWEMARDDAYKGSIQHFYKSLVNKNLEQEGFMIFKEVNILNKERAPDVLIDAKLNFYANLTDANGSLSKKESDSLNYWIKQKNKLKSFSEFDKRPINLDTLVHAYNENVSFINFKDILFVAYLRENEPPSFRLTGYQIPRSKDIFNFQVSKITPLKKSPIFFFKNGNLDDAGSAIYEGYWAYEKVGDQVPLDYVPKR